MVGCLEGKGETGDTAADNEEIAFDAHNKASLHGLCIQEIRIIDRCGSFVKRRGIPTIHYLILFADADWKT